ncbi:conserved hypothetical protein, partial [Trichinella spiralis]|uniref:hypothetical protein n=1 Tax=Trichinella spiralis TaxID=6334 RepID=UPI0001EFD629
MHAAGWSVSDELCVQRETNKKAQIVKANWANPTAAFPLVNFIYLLGFTVSNIIKMQDEKSSTSENVPCNQSSVQSCSISEERSILLSQAAIMDVVENLRTSNKQDGVQNLTARQTWPNISGFQVGRRFKSFLEFEQAFDAWKSEHFHTFRVASSEILRLKDGMIDPIFKYRYIVYHCAHYGVPRVR